MLRFAINAYGRFIANYSTWNLDNLLVGWRFGPAALGFYKKAYDLFALSTSQLTAPLTSVAVATLSRLNHDAAQYRRYLLGSISVMAFVGMGLGGGLTLVGKDLIRLLLGPPWAESGRIFMYFGPGIGMMLLYYTHGWIHLSIGRADRWLRWSLAEFCVTALLFLTGLPWGPVGIAVAWTVSFWILTFPSFWYAGKPINLGPAAMFLAVWRYVAASLAAGVVSAAIIEWFPSLAAASGAAGAAVRMAVVSFLFCALYIGGVVLLHGSREPLTQVARLLRDIIPWRSLPTSPRTVAWSQSAVATPTRGAD